MTTEQQILNVFKDVLEENIDSTADFFERGGDSLDVLASVNQLADDYNIEIKVDAIYQYSTARQLAQYVDKKYKNTDICEESFTNTISPISYSEKSKKIAAYYTQRIYFYKKKNNSLIFELSLENDISNELIKNTLESLMDLNPILKSTFQQNKKDLFLIIHERTKIKSINNFNQTYDKQNIADQLKSHLFYSRYNEGLLLNFAIIKESTNKKLFLE